MPTASCSGAASSCCPVGSWSSLLLCESPRSRAIVFAASIIRDGGRGAFDGSHTRGERYEGVIRFWILDFGFWIVRQRRRIRTAGLGPQSKIQNPKSKIGSPPQPHEAGAEGLVEEVGAAAGEFGHGRAVAKLIQARPREELLALACWQRRPPGIENCCFVFLLGADFSGGFLLAFGFSAALLGGAGAGLLLPLLLPALRRGPTVFDRRYQRARRVLVLLPVTVRPVGEL